MVPVKINIFLSFAPEDKPELEVLLKWLYPMRDEVNLWYNDPPDKAPELPLPWQLLLFWYSPPDFREKYQRALQARREKAHIYLFLTSYKSLSNKAIEEDIDVAANRRIAGDNHTGPFVFPLILSPSRWQEESRLAAFTPMAEGVPLSSFKQKDEGYLTVTEELAELIKLLQIRLGEVKFYQSRVVSADQEQVSAKKKRLPYLGEPDGSLEFQEATPFQPSEWFGWSLILFIFISVIGSLMPSRVLGPSRYENARSANDHGMEYLREHPMVQPTDSMVFPPAN